MSKCISLCTAEPETALTAREDWAIIRGVSINLLDSENSHANVNNTKND